MERRKPLLPIRIRKLLGLIGLLLLLFVYALIVMTIAVSGRVPQEGGSGVFLLSYYRAGVDTAGSGDHLVDAASRLMPSRVARTG
jgi:hypothetical protein